MLTNEYEKVDTGSIRTNLESLKTVVGDYNIVFNNEVRNTEYAASFSDFLTITLKDNDLKSVSTCISAIEELCSLIDTCNDNYKIYKDKYNEPRPPMTVTVDHKDSEGNFLYSSSETNPKYTEHMNVIETYKINFLNAKNNVDNYNF